jgi:glutamyl-Q tRNA(Asp) synthetase
MVADVLQSTMRRQPPGRQGGYVGRFAPSPTGPLHFGSLLAATASYLQARAAAGRWLVRMEDIDPPREQPSAAALILDALEAYGFEWHGAVTWQRHNRQAHLLAIESLLQSGNAYRCGCSRRDIADAADGASGPVYPGTCRTGTTSRDYAIRALTNNDPVSFTDGLQGALCQRLESEAGDFVVLRRDGLIAYQLAVVVDDASQGVTEVVRGLDLFDSTPRQIHLQRLLGLPTPAYLHIPLAENASGQKLSKRNGAPALDLLETRPVLLAALRALELPVMADLEACSLSDIWDWACTNWQVERLQNQKSIVCSTAPLAGTENGLS